MKCRKTIIKQYQEHRETTQDIIKNSMITSCNNNKTTNNKLDVRERARSRRPRFSLLCLALFLLLWNVNAVVKYEAAQANEQNNTQMRERARVLTRASAQVAVVFVYLELAVTKAKAQRRMCARAHDARMFCIYISPNSLFVRVLYIFSSPVSAPTGTKSVELAFFYHFV